jgi:hypothetical protein
MPAARVVCVDNLFSYSTCYHTQPMASNSDYTTKEVKWNHTRITHRQQF